ncbi:hypothetical protein KL86PLE_110043 [uncultured Pleomorphomonas sp.]|uniref:Uncharacterized protein n=1 Tax=uncultured Pleomorphomonas sp. TaxID=442121 RepID=A0A212L766_9HYPH|nr:DUF2635 domain-containing protein [uncultured Pleomorphomonas sp.]SCM73378.1 hypothetical protein KL86PLE_110043 [uncultured Pleomorphomonas sp.]
MDIVSVKPRDGLAVVMPDRGRLASADGENVDREAPYYAKAIRDGDLVVVTGKAGQTKSAASGEGSK